MNSSIKYIPIKVCGFPHSDITGSKRTSSSPMHIVGSHVLHRLLLPRHPPCALINLTTKIYIPNLMSYEILISTLLLITHNIHYLVFKEQNLEKSNDLSKLSKIIKCSFYIRTFVSCTSLPSPEVLIRFLSNSNNSIERR